MVRGALGEAAEAGELVADGLWMGMFTLLTGVEGEWLIAIASWSARCGNGLIDRFDLSSAGTSGFD